MSLEVNADLELSYTITSGDRFKVINSGEPQAHTVQHDGYPGTLCRLNALRMCKNIRLAMSYSIY